MPGPNKPDTLVAPDPSKGLTKPIYSLDRNGNPTKTIIGYEQDINAVESGKIEAPKSEQVLALEEKLGRTLEPIYATGQTGGQYAETVEYGKPIGYRYDNGKSQYVNFDTSGEQTGIVDRNTTGALLDFGLKVLAIAYPPAAPFVAAYNTVKALEDGDALLALANAAGAGKFIPGLSDSTVALLKNVSTGAKIVDAVQSKDPIKIFTSTVDLPGVPVDLKNVSNILNIANSIKTGNLDGLIDVASNIQNDTSKTADSETTAAMSGGFGDTADSGTTDAMRGGFGDTSGGLLSDTSVQLDSGTTDAISGGFGDTSGGLLSDTNVNIDSGKGLTANKPGAEGMGGGTGLIASVNESLIPGAPLATPVTGAPGMGGGTGLTARSNAGAPVNAPLAMPVARVAGMGGGTGLTVDAAGGGTIGANGVTLNKNPIISETTDLPNTPGLPLAPLLTIGNVLTAASVISSIAKANETTPTAAPFTMAPYVPPSGKPFANLGMSPIAAPYTPTRILGQYDPTMTPGGVSPYELIMQQMQAPNNLYANFEAGTNIGGFDPQRFVTAAPPNNMGGMIDKSRMVGPNPMGPDNGFASIQDGEFVMNRKATQKYGIELMNAINSGKISKGKLSGLLEA